ncbi:MAG: helix-turn-helix transcriptional regulator [Geminicoccaceae bacterium]|nr:helix-turn-helix transcriptional regulator [Geminicoccaceae bacterium]
MIGERVAASREELGLSRRSLARRLGRSEAWLRRIEGGHARLTVDMAYRIAEALRVDPCSLFGGLNVR